MLKDQYFKILTVLLKRIFEKHTQVKHKIRSLSVGNLYQYLDSTRNLLQNYLFSQLKLPRLIAPNRLVISSTSAKSGYNFIQYIRFSIKSERIT